MYALNGVPEYWMVDVVGADVHQFWSPSEAGYRDRRTVPIGEELRSATMPELAIDSTGL